MIPDINFSYYINNTFAAEVSLLEDTFINVAVGANTVNGKIIETTANFINHYFYFDDNMLVEIQNYLLDGQQVTGIPIVLDRNAWYETVEQAVTLYEI